MAIFVFVSDNMLAFHALNEWRLVFQVAAALAPSRFELLNARIYGRRWELRENNGNLIAHCRFTGCEKTRDLTDVEPSKVNSRLNPHDFDHPWPAKKKD
jgi:hypothetical protein